MSAPLPLTVFTGWLASGERGISSEKIVSRLTGQQVGRYEWLHNTHPHDPDDFRRCELLLRQVPVARLAFPAMRTASDEWARLVDAWDELVALLEQEAPGVFDGSAAGWRAPLSYQRMNELLHPERVS